MKAILTMTMMLSLLITSVYAHPPAEKPSEGLITEQPEQDIKLCTQNLVAIGKAIQAYQKEHGDFPEWLSELYPKYLPDAEILLCPADNKGGKPVFSKNADPEMPVSYGYQFHPGYRKSTQENRVVYGDVIPLARCRHHKNQEFECLNLGFSFKVYKSHGVWQDTPEVMYETIEKTITALEAGLQRQPDIVRSFKLYSSLVRLYIEVGREKDVNSLIKRFRSSVKPGDLQTQTMLGAILANANRYEEMLTVYEKLEKQYPNKSFVLNELARIHSKLGNSELAAEYQKKADPMAALVGKVVPDFTATDLDGKLISLQQYRGKVVLLDFWAVWCGPCISEMPNVKRVYNTYKNQGFDIIGVSLDTDEVRLRNYLKANDIPWRQIFSGQKWNSPLAKYYHIRSIPAPWLIARDGTLISREARGIALERLVVEALKDKAENE
ncbi:MAG: redoxin domain-containing protein [Candidatus Poribacteria bacterium]|nr:redoxin domain-containing protein [Candidatus Poribacteria bacterium]